MRIASFLKTLLSTLLVGSLTWSAQAQFTTFTHIGGGETGSIITNGLGSYTFEGGGNDIWSATDEFDYAHFEATGDFDVRARVESLEPTARWAKAGLMARETLAGNSRMAFTRVTPADVPSGNGGNGANDTRFAFRVGTTSGPQGENEAGAGGPEYPNGWIRLQRTGNVMNSYRSSDGASWSLLGTQDTATWEGGALPAAVQLGFAVGRHSGTEPLATAQFRDFGTPTDTIAITTQPASQTKVVGQTATFFVRLPGGADFAVFQWFTNGTPIPGANSVSYTTPALAVANNGVVYSVGASNVNNASVALSGNAVLTVVDAPELVSASTLNNPVAAYITFTRAMNATALNPANYTVNNGVTVSAAEFTTAASNVVKITTTTLAADTTYQISISGVQDLAGTTINPEPSVVNVRHTVSFGGITMRRYDGSGDFATVKNKIDTCVTPNRVNPNLDTFAYGTNPSINNTAGDGDTENYGTLLYGLFVPTTTGNYRFAIKSDDSSELYLSSDATPANKVLLTAEGGCCTPYPSHMSGLIPLVAGNRYFLEARHQEGGGGDHVQVTMQLPGGPAITDGNLAIPNSQFAPVYSLGCPPVFVNSLGPVALTGPGNQSVVENSTATFTTVLGGSPPFTVQWYSNGVAIAGATSSTYSFSAQTAANGKVFSVVVNNQFSSSTNSSTLTVIPAPQILEASSRFDNSGTNIYVLYSKDMGASALATGSYTVDNSVTVSAAAFHMGNPRLVRLTVSSLTPGASYNVTGTGITDPDGNLLNPNPTIRTFVHLSGPGVNPPQGLTIKRYEGTGDFAQIKNKIATCVTPNFINTEAATMEYSSFLPGYNDPVVRSDPGLENYGAWIYGQFAPPTTGNYVFGLASDDVSELWLSTDSSPANKVLISSMPNWGGSRDFVLPANGNTVVPLTAGIPLVAGRTYYMEALFQEGGGGDHLSVAVQVPGGPAIIDGTQNVMTRSMFVTNSSFGCPPQYYFNFGPIMITQQPVDATVNELSTANFMARVDGSPAYSFQWYSNNVAVPGATSANYSFAPLRYANGAQYRLVANNGFSSATSAVVTLTVISDEVPPAVTSILSAPSRTVLGIIFNEPLTLLQATNPANYVITNAAGAVLAHSASVLPEVGADGRSVTLRTAPQISGAQYFLVLNNLTDRAGVPNSIAPNTVAPFTASDLFYAPGAVVFRAYPTGGGNAIAELTNHPSYLNNMPDYEQVISSMNSRTAGPPYNNNGRENYGGGIIGHFIPPVSGNWIFYISADDDGLLLMNTNGPNSSGKTTVRFAPGCCRALSAGSDPTPPIRMLAGQAYYIEALYKEGGGGDYVEVGARLQGDTSPIVVIGSANLAFASRLTITQNPTNLTLLEGENASFTSSVSVAGAGAGSQRYQWERSDDAGVTFTDIAGATSASYTFRAFMADNQSQFRVRAFLPGLQTNTSSAATLTVEADAVAPTLLSARVGDSYNQVILTYSEAIDANTASEASNFYIDENIFGAVREVFGSVIVITLSQPLLPNTPYILYGSGQADQFGNATDPADTVSTLFIYQPTGLTHRYSFGNVPGVATGSNVLDSIGGAHGTVLGAGASFTGQRLALAGGAADAAAYVDLPNGLLSTNGAVNGGSGQLTFEGWVRVTGNRAWSRIVDFGRGDVGELNGPGGGGGGQDYLFYGAQENANTGRRNFVVRDSNPLPNGTTPNLENGPAYNISNFGTEYHFVITWDEASGQVRVYENTVQVAAFVTPIQMHFIDDINVWLGRSQFGGDQNLQGEYNEFRIYDRVLTPAEIAFNNTSGPNYDFGTPTAVRLTVSENPTSEGRSLQAQVVADFATVSNVNLTSSQAYTISSGNIPVVSVGAGGVLQAGAAGSASLTATFAGVTSEPVIVTVDTDAGSPSVVTVRGVRSLNAISVQFSEEVSAASAQNIANYALTDTNSNTIAISAATLSADGTRVVLSIPSHAPGTVYNLGIAGITDIAASANGINPTNITFQTWTIGLGSLAWDSYLGIVGGLAELTNNPSFPNNPDESNHIAAANSRLFYADDSREHYGARISGYFVPQYSTNYTFYVSSDDASRLFLSTDSQETNEVLVTEETGCCAPFAAHPSASIPLIAGQLYYMELLYKEGGGGDYGQVAVKRTSDPRDPNTLQPIHGSLLASLADPVGASITITQQPVSMTVTQGVTVTLTAGVTTTNDYGDFNQIVYQWEKRTDGGDWRPIVGANTNSFTVPTVPPGSVTDYRLKVYIPGAQATTATATVAGLLAISWPGSPAVLQQADQITGPWTDIPAAANPLIVDPNDSVQKFYRLKP